MSDSEIVQDAIEKTHEEDEAHTAGMGRTRRIAAIVLTLLGATGVICSMQANDAQTEYLVKTTEFADTWAQYQGKSDRRAIDLGVAEIERHLATTNANDLALTMDMTKRAAEAQRMQSDTAKGDGMEQLAAKAHEIDVEREGARHKHDRVELGTRVVELCAMVTGLSLAVESVPLLAVAAIAGIAGAAYSIGASFGLL